VVVTLFMVAGISMQAAALTFPIAAGQRAGAECIANVASREDVSAIIGEYWVAKPVKLFSAGRANVVQVQSNMDPYLWITSRGWHRSPHAFGMVIMNNMKRQRVEAMYGRPAEVAFCAPYEVYVYRGRARGRMTDRMRGAFDKAVGQSDAQRKLGWN
jgi:hypothetical protein